MLLSIKPLISKLTNLLLSKLLKLLNLNKSLNYNNLLLIRLIHSPAYNLINILSNILICLKLPIIFILFINIAMEEHYKNKLNIIRRPNRL
jgi:hypothetical protein